MEDLRPERGDVVEAWLKRWRDDFHPHSYGWHLVDGLLYDYRLHADTGTLLSEDVEMP